MKKTTKTPELSDENFVLEENSIGAIWQICFIANSFVFPINAFFDKEYEISRLEFVILYILAHRDNLMAWEICRISSLPKNNVSRGVQKLEQKGRIERSPDPDDARRALLHMTAAGRAFYEELLEHYQSRANAFLSLLDDDDKADLERITVKLSKALPTLPKLT